MRALPLLLLALTAAGSDWDARFAAAERSDAEVVPLVLAVSQALPQLADAEAYALAERLRPFQRRLFASSERLPGMDLVGLRLHRVAVGESLWSIAKHYHVRHELIARLNDGARSLSAGQELKVLDGASRPLVLVVHKSRYRMIALLRGADGSAGVLLACFPCGIGADASPTPEGSTSIRIAVRNPEWTHPDTGEVLRPDDPRNVLGGYWLGFDPGPDKAFTGIGIHGYTGEPAADWIERGASHGCIRLLQEDIGWLFEVAKEGARVVVVP